MNKNKLRIVGVVAIIIGIIVTTSGILVSISESNTIGFIEGTDDDAQLVIPNPDEPENWIGIIEDEIVTTYIPTTDTGTIVPTIPPIEIDTINFDSLVFELIDEFIIECRFGFLYNQHNIKEATISFSKNDNQLLDENNNPVFFNCDKIGLRAFSTEFNWWSFPDGQLDIDITIKFDVFINGVTIPDLVDTIGYYDDKGTLTIPEHTDSEPVDIVEEYHFQQGLGKWLITAGLFIAIIGIVSTVVISRKMM